MSANVDLHFCDLCGLSIPQKDLDSDLAKIINGKTVGVCCLALILDQKAGSVHHAASPKAAQKAQPGLIGAGGKPAFAGGSAQGGGGLFPTAILLVALAAAAAFVEWRASDRSGRTRGEIRALSTKLDANDAALEALDAKVTSIPAKSMEAKLLTLQAEADKLGQDILEIKPADNSALQSTLKELNLRLENLAVRLASIEGRQSTLDRSMQGGFEDLAKEIGRMGSRSISSGEPSTKADSSNPNGKSSTAEPTLELPDDLAKDIKKLADPEAGVRWAAIDALLSKKDPRVVPHLVPTLKDEDPFIRRLTATGLGKLGDKRAIWPLFDAMSDSESIVRSAAYRSLVKLTKEFGKSLAFDPDASKDKRKSALKKWKEWLEKRAVN